LVSLAKNDYEKQKLLPFASLAKNDKEKTKLSPFVSLAKNAQNKKLSPLLSLEKNDQEKQKLSPLVTLAKNDEKTKNFHHRYPWPKMLKKTKIFTFDNLGQKMAKIIFLKTSEIRMKSVFA